MYTNTYVHMYTWVLKMEGLKIKPAPPRCSPRTGVMDGDAGSCVSIALSRVLKIWVKDRVIQALINLSRRLKLTPREKANDKLMNASRVV